MEFMNDIEMTENSGKVCSTREQENEGKIIEELFEDIICRVVGEIENESNLEKDAISSLDLITWETFFNSNEPLETSLELIFGNDTFSEKNYLKGLKWSPCGNQLLGSFNDNHMRTYNLVIHHTLKQSQLELATKCYDGEEVYDFSWYPGSTIHDESSCCFITTSRGQPIHLWDPLNAVIRCSYRPYNAVDEMESAVSVSFDAYGERIFCGFSNCVRVFHTSRPGRDFEQRPTYVNKEGQNGLISCFAFNQSQPHTYACGSYSKTVSLCDDASGEVVMVFSGHSGGVTHLAFSNDGNRLFSGGRKDDEILCWDLRRPGHVLKALRRNVSTNQRIFFDLDPTDRYVVSGNHDGHISLWDNEASFDDKNNVKASLHSHCHDDVVNSVSFHPWYPIIASGSGQRHFKLPCTSDDDDDDEEDDADEVIDNSVKLWLLNCKNKTD